MGVLKLVELDIFFNEIKEKSWAYMYNSCPNYMKTLDEDNGLCNQKTKMSSNVS
jgi:hypothetical protein